MKRLIASILLLAGLAAPALLAMPALGVGQLDEIAPLLSYPSLSFTRDSGWHVDHQAPPWGRYLRPAEYVIGTTRTEGMAGAEALVIAARPGASTQSTAAAKRTIPIEDGWRGKLVRLSARMKSSGVETAGLWLHVPRPGPVRRVPRGYAGRSLRDRTNDWCRMELTMRIPPEATSLSYGISLTGGEGRVYADSFVVEVQPTTMPRRLPDSCRPPRETGWPNYGRDALNQP